MSIENAISQLKTLMGDRLTVSVSGRKQYGQNETYYKEMLPDAVAYPEDDPIKMEQFALNLGFKFPYLYDAQ